MRPSRNNLGESHENGSIESRQGSLKNAIDPALLLRGHRRFAELADYRRFIADVVARLNRRVQVKVTEKRTALNALPVRRTSDYEEAEARVTKYSTVSLKRILYSVPSRLIGHRPVSLQPAHLPPGTEPMQACRISKEMSDGGTARHRILAGAD